MFNFILFPDIYPLFNTKLYTMSVKLAELLRYNALFPQLIQLRYLNEII